MKEAYKKALQVISSCKNSLHIRGAYNYIHNFRVLYGKDVKCKQLTDKLMEKCSKHRNLLDQKR